MKFRWKLALSMVCLLAVLYGAGGSALLSLSFESALAREQRSAKGAYRQLLSTVALTEELGAWRSNRRLSDLLAELSPQNGTAWAALTLTDESGAVLYTQGDAAADFVADVAPADGAHGTCAYFSDAAGRRYLQLTGCFSVGAQRNTLAIAWDITHLYAERRQLLTAYWAIFAGMIALCALLAYLISRYLTRPLERLSTATQALAAGDLSYRTGLRPGDEIGAVGADFDAMAAQLERTVHALQAAMDRQEQFIGSFTHELKTPMTAIIGYADLLREQALTPAEQQDAANYIYSEARRLERLSLRLLDILVAEHAQPALSAMPPAALLEDLAQHLAPGLAAQHVALHESCGEGVCLLEPDLVRSLLMNLIDNARKAMPAGGEITLTGELTPEGCILTVADTGTGIPPEALAHLTEAFYRVDKSRSRAQGGAGLGLTLCARIAALHGGSLRFESEPGRGTRAIAELKGGRA
jgi:signal transduction histidine kinase